MKNVLIVGAGTAGKDVLREIKRSRPITLDVVGFIDDDPLKLQADINGIKVLGGKDYLERIIKKKKVEEIIIAIPSAKGEEIRQYVNICCRLKIAFKIVPRVKEIIEGKAHLESVRKVEVEDLLGRPVVKSDIRQLKKFLGERSILITGAAGSIGSEISRQIAAYKPKNLILLDWWENGIFELQMEMNKDFPDQITSFIIGNIQDREKVRRVIAEYKPDYIFHAAAYKHVPMMEEYPDEAVKNNVFGTLNLAREAKLAGVKKFVLISTDKAANPVNIMGATKLITEGIGKMLNSRKTKFMAVRFGNVLGSFGSVIPIFRKQIEAGGPLTITDPAMTRYFMTIPEAAQLILKAAQIGKGGELFVLDMGRPIKILDIAQMMIRLSGLVPGKDIKIKYTGTRKGEKISEEVLTNREKLAATKDGKIYISQSLGFDISRLPLFLKRVKKLSLEGNNVKIREEIRKMIPSVK